MRCSKEQLGYLHKKIVSTYKYMSDKNDIKWTPITFFLVLLTGVSHLIFHTFDFMPVLDSEIIKMLPYSFTLYTASNNLIKDSDIIELPENVKKIFETPQFKYFVLFLCVFYFSRNAILSGLIVLSIALCIQYMRSPKERKNHPYLL